MSGSKTSVILPDNMYVFERGWLSSNNILLLNDGESVLVDSGYCTHASQTIQLVKSVLQERSLDLLLNTHLHSDHCGGNAALQAQFLGLRTHIPPGGSGDIAQWNTEALTYDATGQTCPRFRFDGVLTPGSSMILAGSEWEVHAAPGHDPHAILLFNPETRVLISADALWEDGFGVVFPELEGMAAFEEVDATLTLVESLRPGTVIPGHGSIFTDVSRALDRARRRLDYFVAQPERHDLYAAKVLVKFKLLELQQCALQELEDWAKQTPYIASLQRRLFPDQSTAAITEKLVAALVKAGAAQRDGNMIANKD